MAYVFPFLIKYVHINLKKMKLSTKYQQIIAQSSTEAEFIAAAEAGKQALYLRSILQDIGIPQESATTIFEDNNGALLLATNQRVTSRTKYFNVKWHFFWQHVKNGDIKVERISTTDQLADFLGLVK